MVSFMFVNVPQIYLYLIVKIFSHQHSPGVVYQGFFATRFKIEEIDHMPVDYLVTLFSFARFIRWGNPSYRRFLKRGNYVIAISTKVTRYCHCVNQIHSFSDSVSVRKMHGCQQNTQNFEEIFISIQAIQGDYRVLV